MENIEIKIEVTATDNPKVRLVNGQTCVGVREVLKAVKAAAEDAAKKALGL